MGSHAEEVVEVEADGPPLDKHHGARAVLPAPSPMPVEVEGAAGGGGGAAGVGRAATLQRRETGT